MLRVPLACEYPALEPMARPDKSARFVLDVPARRVRTRDDLQVYFVVTNTGTAPLWLNGRMLLGPGRGPSPFQELWVEASGPGAVAWWCFFNTPAVQPKHYSLLWPGESAGRKPGGRSEDLRCLGLDAPGAYTLIAHYQDGNDRQNVPPAPWGSRYVGWELVSDPVTVEITEGSARSAFRTS